MVKKEIHEMNTKEYQSFISELLEEIFGAKSLVLEWDSLKYDLHIDKHIGTYGPRPDIAVGPYNDSGDLDVNKDKTKLMKEHPFTKRIVQEIGWTKEDFTKSWNTFSRCYLAIEIELGSNKKSSNSSKHILGSMINASATGSLGIVIFDKNTKNKVSRIYQYLLTLSQFGRMQFKTLDNLIRIDKDDFVNILKEFCKTNKS
jgi:hypothetical protein